MIGISSPGKSYSTKFANFHFNEFEKLFVVNLINFVQEPTWPDANLTGKQDVLAGLRHRAVSCVHNEDPPSIWAAPVIVFT